MNWTEFHRRGLLKPFILHNMAWRMTQNIYRRCCVQRVNSKTLGEPILITDQTLGLYLQCFSLCWWVMILCTPGMMSYANLAYSDFLSGNSNTANVYSLENERQGWGSLLRYLLFSCCVTCWLHDVLMCPTPHYLLRKPEILKQ